MLLVAEAIDLLQLLDHLATVDAALSVRNRLFALLFIEFSQYLGLVDLSRNEVYHVELAAWASIDFGVLNLGPLRTFLLNLGHFSFFREELLHSGLYFSLLSSYLFKFLLHLLNFLLFLFYFLSEVLLHNLRALHVLLKAVAHNGLLSHA